MDHPYADLIGFEVTDRSHGKSTVELVVQAQHMNPHHVVHGAVLFALADTGMGSALYSYLDEGESCATINGGINYFRGVTGGTITCHSHVTNKGRNIATMDSELWNEGKLVATAHSQFSIFMRR